MMRALTAKSGLGPGVNPRRWAGLLLGILLAVPAAAHEGEVHDDFPLAAAGQNVAPRFAATGDAVEVVGALQDGQLWLYVSRFATNAPWSGLSIEVERDGGGVRAEPVAEGVYRIPAGELEENGLHAVVMTLHGEGLDELLMAQLAIENAPEREVEPSWRQMSMGLSLLVAAVVIHLLHGWRVRRRRQEAPRG